MKKTLVLFALNISAISLSQETEIDSLNKDNNSGTVAFSVIKHVPVYKGCDDSMTNIELKNCMSSSISKHISKHFNTKITNGLGLPDGNVRINVILKTDKEGNIKDIRSGAQHPAL